MYTMLKADFYRIRKGNLGYIAAIILFLFGIFLGILGKDYSVGEMIELMLATSSLLMPIIITNLLMIVWGHDFNTRTVNNTLIGGTSRLKFFIEKFVLTAILTGIFLIIFGLSVVTCNLVFQGSTDLVYLGEILLAQYPLYLAVSSLGVLFFNIFKTSYVSVALFMVVCFIGDNLISTVVGTYLKAFDFVLDYLFVSNISNIVNLNALPGNLITTYLVSALVLSFIFIVVSYQIFRNREFK